MQSAQESLAELRAAIRYCENAISAAESTIESIDFRLQMKSDDPNVTLEGYKNVHMKQRQQIKDLEDANESLVIDNDNLSRENAKLRKKKEALSGPCGCQAYRDLEEKVATMPVIPRDVAIAIFREGQRLGYNNKSVDENLKGLCKNLNFECRIHGIDDND